MTAQPHNACSLFSAFPLLFDSPSSSSFLPKRPGELGDDAEMVLSMVQSVRMLLIFQKSSSRSKNRHYSAGQANPSELCSFACATKDHGHLPFSAVVPFRKISWPVSPASLRYESSKVETQGDETSGAGRLQRAEIHHHLLMPAGFQTPFPRGPGHTGG